MKKYENSDDDEEEDDDNSGDDHIELKNDDNEPPEPKSAFEIYKEKNLEAFLEKHKKRKNPDQQWIDKKLSNEYESLPMIQRQKYMQLAQKMIDEKRRFREKLERVEKREKRRKRREDKKRKNGRQNFFSKKVKNVDYKEEKKFVFLFVT